ncbi:MAG: MATE family efflux transporter [Coprococcus sp.]
MNRQVTKDLTTGSPMRLILGFGIPLLFGMLFQQFYSMVDTIIVGQFLGVKALASVGATGSINFMIIGFCMGVCNGFAIPVAQRFGAKDEHGLRKYVANSAWLAAAFSIIMAVIVCTYCRQILELMQTPEDIIDGAYSYIFVIFLGIPATYLYNLLSGIMRSLGDSKTPLYFLVFSSLLNIVFDLIAILILKMGVAGAAWATVLAQGISGILCLGVMVKKFAILRMQENEWHPDKICLVNLCNMGIPMGLQYSITAIGSVILQTAVNSLGSMAVASVAAATKISMFLTCPYEAMGSTMATYAGQNVGADKLDRLEQGVKSCGLLGFIYSAIAFGLIALSGRAMALLFVDASETVVLNQAQIFLMANGACYFLLSLVNIVRFTIQGMGFSRLAIIAGVCEMVARSAAGFILVPAVGYIAVCFASPLAWLMADCFLIPAFLRSVRILEKRSNKNKEQLRRKLCTEGNA